MHGFVKKAMIQFFEIKKTILLALLISLAFKLNKKNHKIIIEEISHLRNGGSKFIAKKISNLYSSWLEYLMKKYM